MTLEDFFTLSEMKDGLTAPSRVHELVSVMQKERDCTVKNVGDATRQWAAVASTIAATDNRDCLDLFIQLDGLSFIDKWLKDAKRYGNDGLDGFMEESLSALLRALEKLQIDKERSVSSGIWITVNSLLDHGSSRVQDTARALFDSWKLGKASDDVGENNRGAESVAVDVAEPAGEENLQSKGLNCLQQEKAKEQPDINMEHLSPDPGNAPVLSNSMQESPPLKEKATVNAVEGTTLTETRFSISELDTSKKLDDSNRIASPSSKVEAGATSCAANTPTAKEDTTEPVVKNNIDAKESDFGSNSVSSDTGKCIPLPKSGKDDEVAKTDCSPDMMPDSPLSNKKLEKSEDIETPFSHMLDIRADDDDDDDDDGDDEGSDVPDYLKDGCDLTKTTDTLSSGRNNRSKTNIELDYGMDDALKVARRVAKEVEREVVDYRNRSCSSSSDKIMVSSDIRRPGSPDSINTKQDLHREVTNEDMPSGQNLAAEAFPVENSRELESSQVTEVAPEQEIKAVKGVCDFDLNDFDLNQEVCSDDMERTANPITTPISVVSASRPAVVSGSPSAPLQFEGILGWKGSASTSAFRPASPRKIFETGGSSNSSQQRKGSLDFDLNVAEDGDKILDLMPGRPIPVSSGLQSGESSLEIGPRRSERPNLDLNRMVGNEGDVPQPSFRMEGQLFYPRNGHRSPSPASSSSSMQPSLRNFDLNDRPLFHNGNQNAGPFSVSRPGDPVISILGTRVEVGSSRAEISRRDFIPQHPSLANGKPPMESMMDGNMARMGGILGIPTVPFTHSQIFGYNGPTTPPHMSAMYGAGPSIPYMMDTRIAAASMVPQILNSPAVPPYSQPSFMMNMGGGPPSFNGAGPSFRPPNFDLNSGFANEGGNSGGLRQFLMPGQSRSLEDPMRANVQPSPSLGLGVKRREPDGGWEPYSLAYKHPQHPWR